MTSIESGAYFGDKTDLENQWNEIQRKLNNKKKDMDKFENGGSLQGIECACIIEKYEDGGEIVYNGMKLSMYVKQVNNKDVFCVKFDGKPSENILIMLKKNGFRYYAPTKEWTSWNRNAYNWATSQFSQQNENTEQTFENENKNEIIILKPNKTINPNSHYIIRILQSAKNVEDHYSKMRMDDSYDYFTEPSSVEELIKRWQNKDKKYYDLKLKYLGQGNFKLEYGWQASFSFESDIVKDYVEPKTVNNSGKYPKNDLFVNLESFENINNENKEFEQLFNIEKLNFIESDLSEFEENDIILYLNDINRFSKIEIARVHKYSVSWQSWSHGGDGNKSENIENHIELRKISTDGYIHNMKKKYNVLKLNNIEDYIKYTPIEVRIKSTYAYETTLDENIRGIISCVNNNKHYIGKLNRSIKNSKIWEENIKANIKNLLVRKKAFLSVENKYPEAVRIFLRESKEDQQLRRSLWLNELKENGIDEIPQHNKFDMLEKQLKYNIEKGKYGIERSKNINVFNLYQYLEENSNNISEEKYSYFNVVDDSNENKEVENNNDDDNDYINESVVSEKLDTVSEVENLKDKNNASDVLSIKIENWQSELEFSDDESEKKALELLIKINKKRQLNINEKYEDGGLINSNCENGCAIVGNSHLNGGVQGIVNGEKYIELEGDEIVICEKAVNDPKKRVFIGTNAQILDKINTSNGGNKLLNKYGNFIYKVSDEYQTVKFKFGQVVINKKAVLDKNTYTYKGTNKEILSLINESTGGKPIFKKGGEIYQTELDFSI